MVVVNAFTVFSLPFVLAEAATGVVSFLTGALSIPPVVGIGMAVDLAMFLAGTGTVILIAKSPRAKVTEDLASD